METIGPNTRPIIMMLLLLWLWVLLLGPSVYSSPLELQLMEMMLREAEGYPSNGRDLRDISVLPATSIQCDDKDISLMKAASIGCDESGSQEPFSDLLFDDDESEECMDFLAPYEPSFQKDLPVEHPCFVRLLLLRTPLLKEDPCANFTSATKTTKNPKRKCNPKGKQKEVLPKENHDHKRSTECSPVNATTCSSILSDEPLSSNSTTSSPPETQSTPKTIRLRKLVPKNRKLMSNSTTSTTPSTITTTMETTGPDSKIINIRKYPPKTRKIKPNSTTSTTVETTTEEETTLPDETTSATTENPSTNTTKKETTTPDYSTTTTERALTDNQLKRLKAAQIRRRNRKGYGNGTPKVPDPPKIKIDGASQPSEVIHVILPTDAAEMRLTPEEDSTTTVMPTTPTTASTSEPETTTEDSCEDDEETTTKLPEFFESEDSEGEASDRSESKGINCESEDAEGEASDWSESKRVKGESKDVKSEASDRSESKGVNSMEEPCEDTEEQGTNLCPQFVPAQRHSNSLKRLQTPYRNRKPVKNYVEPILYEGNIARPLHRTTRIRPPQKDYFISNKQIVPRPKPKYRKRLPHSIYMNNIVRGLDCVDEVNHHPSRNPTQPQQFWDMRRVGPGQRMQNPRQLIPERNHRDFAPVPARRLLSQPGSQEESDESQYPRESQPHPQQHQYPEDEETVLHEERPMPMPMPPQATPTPILDPCQAEHDHALYDERREHPGDYPQTPASSHFFT